jgi:hypothetical protein
LISSVLGLIGLFWYIHKLPVNTRSLPTSTKEQIQFWGLITVVALTLGTIRWIIGMPNEKIIAQLIVLVISATMYSTLIVSLYYKFKLPLPI